jgi:ribonuclease HIII
MQTTFSTQLTTDQAERLNRFLLEKGFESKDVPYALFSYFNEQVSITYYGKRQKLCVQGKGTEEWVEFVLEPYILGGIARENVRDEKKITPHFGVDESGKGDYFGPLVIAGVYVDASICSQLRKLGVCDSKQISSDDKIRIIADKMRAIPGLAIHMVSIGPERYNELYGEFKNLNRLLAWGHATVIEGLSKKVPSCRMALSDQFANAYVLDRALAAKKLKIHLEQRHRAESDLAVAAASIFARERFVNWIDATSKAAGLKLPLGASSQVIKAAKKLVATHGQDMLPKVAKIHFKTTAQLGL